MKTKERSVTALLIGLLLLCAAAVFSACGGEKAPQLKDCAVIHETEFGGVYIDKTIEEFNALGFAYGDSVDVEFSNGYKLEGIPYYNGYYTQTGEPLLVAYPGYPHIDAAINNGDSLWVAAGLKEGDTATVTRMEQGKFLDIQNARDIHYKDERSEFPSDEVFANFRSVKAGDIKENMLYRSASPCDNQHNRAPYVDKLMEKAGVDFILDLADNEQKIEKYMSTEGFDSRYWEGLYDGDKVALMALNTNFTSAEFQQKLAAGLAEISQEDRPLLGAGLGSMLESHGPYLVHCTEGKDRTGFVCMLLEALCGASYQEIVDDYMITYDNYYKITKEKDSARYDIIVENVLDPMIRGMIGDAAADLKTADLKTAAENYLRASGLSDAQIQKLRNKLTGAE